MSCGGPCANVRRVSTAKNSSGKSCAAGTDQSSYIAYTGGAGEARYRTAHELPFQEGVIVRQARGSMQSRSKEQHSPGPEFNDCLVPLHIGTVVHETYDLIAVVLQDLLFGGEEVVLLCVGRDGVV